MANRTSIEWVKGADGSEGFSWNALRARRKVGGRKGITANHCEHVNEACRFCYAESLNARLGGLPFKPGHRKDYEFFVDEEKLLEPLRRRKPTRWFVESMSDAFGDWWPDEFIDALYAVKALCPHHTFINLSKRPERRRKYRADPEFAERVSLRASRMLGIWAARAWDALKDSLPNVIEGTSVSCQAEADEFVPLLLLTPAAVHAVSAEPLLGPIDFNRINFGKARHGEIASALDWADDQPRIDWVIVGGESGNRARPMNPDWARSIRDQCSRAGVAFHFKQFGAWAPNGGSAQDYPSKAKKIEFHRFEESGLYVYRVGKKSAGRLLDGKEHNGFPGSRTL